MRLLAALLLVTASAVAQCSYTARYPSAVATDSTLFVARDNVTTSLSSAMAAGDAVAVVKSSTGWAVDMIATVESEKLLVTAVATNVLTVTRGFSGTVAVSHGSGKSVSAFIDCDHHQTVSAEIKAIETTLGPNLSNLINATDLNTSKFDFTPITSGAGVSVAGGNLVIGNNTLTFAIVPLGVNGTDSAHYLYFSGGTGTAEGCLITGGSGIAGGVNGQIIVNCGATHTGAWTVRSASTGASECIFAAGPSGSCRMPADSQNPNGKIDLYAPLTIPDTYNTALRGAGPGQTNIFTHGTTGDWILYDHHVSQGGYVNLGGFSIADSSSTYHTTGTMVRVRWGNVGMVSDIVANYCHDCFQMEDNSRALWTNLVGTTHHYGLYISCAGDAYPGCQSQGTVSAVTILTSATNTHGVHIDAPTTGLTMDQLFVQSDANTSGSVGLYLAGDSVKPLNEIIIGNSFFDGFQVGITYSGGGAASCFNNHIQINNSEIGAGGGGVASNGIFITGVGACNFYSNGNVISASSGQAQDRAIVISAGAGPGLVFASNPQISSDGDAAVLTANTVSGIHFLSNTFCQDTANVGGVSAVAFSLSGILSDLNIKGNDVSTCTSSFSNSATLNAPVLILNNTGIDNVIPAVASAATLPFPVNPVFTITGNTNATAVTFPLSAGARGRFTATAATITFTIGATIGNSWVALQNVPVAWYWDGTKMWFGGGSPLTQFGKCTLGTNCAVTFPVAFTGSTTYQCGAADQTSAAAVKVVNTSAGVATFTGTGTDVISYVCTGN